MNNYSYIDEPEPRSFVIERLSQNTNLSDWEKSFIKSIKEYTDDNGFLSDKQKQKLSDIWEKY